MIAHTHPQAWSVMGIRAKGRDTHGPWWHPQSHCSMDRGAKMTEPPAGGTQYPLRVPSTKGSFSTGAPHHTPTIQWGLI